MEVTAPGDASRRLSIAFVTCEDALDKRSWSCSLYYMAQSLQKHCGDITCINPLPYPDPTFLSKVRAKSSRVFLKRRYIHEASISRARYGSQIVSQKLSGQPFDVIVAAAAEQAIAYLETEIPVVLVGDATFIQLFDYLPYYTHLNKRSMREVRSIEQRVFAKARASIFSSEWAARSAIEDYHVDPQHVYAVPFGTNLDSIPGTDIAGNRKRSEKCSLLFMGVDWARKGGDIALETLVELEKIGIDAELIVCGCTPPARIAHPHMMVIPFLDKNDPRQQQQLEQLFITSDFLLLPTRADCAPNVFREASAFGLPVITTDTGGISSLIQNGMNGYMLPLAARGGEYAALIGSIYKNEQRYRRLTLSSRAEYEKRLNWDAWGQSVKRILQSELNIEETSQVEKYERASF